jgi:hypothetical protein
VGPNAVESPEDTIRAVEQLRAASRKLETSRRNVERSNQGSKQWFNEQKGHRPRSRYTDDAARQRATETSPPE